MKKLTFALYFANRGFFPGELIASAREEMIAAVTKAGHDYIIMDEKATKYGAIETAEDGRKYAEFLRQNKGKYDGVIMSLPNFGDENGAVPALRDAGVPILIQAYRDELGKMDFAHRRDSFCGKFSIMDMFTQFNIPFTVFKPHCVNPDEEIFQEHIAKFAQVCKIVNGMKRFTIGGLGARTTKFKTVRYDELALEKYGITIESYDLSEVFMRIRNIDAARIPAMKEKLSVYTDFSKVAEDKFDIICRTTLAVLDMIDEYHLDAISLRCWDEFHQEFKIAPCVVLSYLNNIGIVASCEMDICNAVTMQAMQLATDTPTACLDWNNDYNYDDNKCILFHCGPVAQDLMAAKGEVNSHKMFAKGYGTPVYGANEGRIAAFPFTFSSMRTENGEMHFYIGEGEFTEDDFDKEFFGCGAVAKIDDLQDKLIYIGRNGYRHHVSVGKGLFKDALEEAFTVYLGYKNVKVF